MGRTLIDTRCKRKLSRQAMAKLRVHLAKLKQCADVHGLKRILLAVATLSCCHQHATTPQPLHNFARMIKVWQPMLRMVCIAKDQAKPALELTFCFQIAACVPRRPVDDDAVCCICLESLVGCQGLRWCFQGCGQNFHAACAKEWEKYEEWKTACPVWYVKYCSHLPMQSLTGAVDPHGWSSPAESSCLNKPITGKSTDKHIVRRAGRSVGGQDDCVHVKESTNLPEYGKLLRLQLTGSSGFRPYLSQTTLVRGPELPNTWRATTTCTACALYPKFLVAHLLGMDYLTDHLFVTIAICVHFQLLHVLFIFVQTIAV